VNAFYFLFIPIILLIVFVLRIQAIIKKQAENHTF
jgi:hypothetical protein